MNNEIYKTKDFLYKDEKDRVKNYFDNAYGYNVESTNKKIIQNDYSKVYKNVNKDYLNNNNIK